MRGLAAAAAALAVAVGCAHAPSVVVEGPQIEVALDEGKPDQRPLTPGQPFELLMRFDPKMAQYRARRLRFQLAQPGKLVFTVYAVDENGRPGRALKTIERDYGPDFAGGADEGKWVVEDLSSVPAMSGALFVGVYSPEKSGDARLWACSNDSGNVFARDTDPALPLSSSRVPRTPRLRVVVAPPSPF